MTTRQRRKAALMLAALTCGVAETAHFGWNFWPRSIEELICDGAAIALMLAAVIPWHRLRWRRSTLFLDMAERLGLPPWASDDALYAVALCKSREISARKDPP